MNGYKAIAGADFVKTIAQRICSCWWYFKITGTITLGLWGEIEITLFETDDV
jgi:hypothetical protein